MLGAAAAGADGPRPLSAAAADQQAKREKTLAEVAAIAAEFHARLPRHAAAAVGAAYARYNSRFQDSVADQVRVIFADAVRKGVFIPLDNVFFDLAVRGFKSDREGLNALRACLDRKAATAVFFFATNRLFRKTYKSLQFVEERVVEKGVRAVFVKSGIDTADAQRWRQALTQSASNDEYVVGMNVENIRAAHEGLLDKRLVFGTVSFGYAGETIPGELTRRGRPRRRLAVDPTAAGYVKTIFRWYVADRVTVAEIVRRLNADPSAPPPPKSPDRRWTRQAVAGILRNPRYRGWWRYGTTETVWVSSKDYARQVARAEPLKGVQIDDLRLVPDDVWSAAQALLAAEPEQADHGVGLAGDGIDVPLEEPRVGLGGLDGRHRLGRLQVAAHPVLRLRPERVPLHQHPPAVRAGVPIHLPVPLAEDLVRQLAGAPADAPPTVLRPGPGEQRRQPERQGLVLHRQGEREPQVVPAFEPAGVVHTPQHGLHGLAAVTRHHGVQRGGDRSVFDSLHQSVELGRGFPLLVLPQPEVAVGVEAVAERRRVLGRPVRQVEVEVQHLDERLGVHLGVGRPHVVGVVVVGDVESLRLGRRRDGQDGGHQAAAAGRRIAVTGLGSGGVVGATWPG